MPSIAELGIKVDSTDAAQASSDLDRLTDSGKKSEEAAKKTGRAWEQALNGMAADTQQIVRELQALNAKQDATAQMMATVGRSINGASTAFTSAAASIDRYRANNDALNATQQKTADAAERAGKAVKSEADQLAALVGKIDPTVAALGRLDDMERKLTGYKNKGLLDVDSFNDYKSKLDQTRAGLTRFDDGLTRTGNTAKQTAAALRGVPAQFTDIAVSLQGGQSPLTVLLQQGGQLKDMFGGVGPAAKALGGYVLGLVNPFTVAAAAAAVLALAYYKGSSEADEYNKALILTGNYAGTSAAQLSDMARQVSATVGTTGAAAAVLAQLAGSGKIASGSFQEITEAALEMEKATGKSVDATVAEFVKIADNPVAAAKSLNEQYHFLTASVYSQIVALKEQGDTVGAVKLLTDTYADTVSTRAGEIIKNLGLIERGWNAIKGAASGALDATLNVGRQETLEQQIASLQKRINTPSSYDAIPVIGEDNPDMTKTGTTQEQDQNRLNFLLLQRDAEASKNKYVADGARIQQEAILATDRADARHLATMTNAEKRALEIKKINEDTEKIRAANPNDKRVSAAYVANQIKDVNDKYKDAKAPGNQLDLTSFNDAQNQIKALTATYSNSQKELESQQKAGIISQESYSAQRAALIQAEKEEVTNAYQAEISALEATRDKSSTTAQQRIQLDQKIADARTSMVKASKDADTELSVLATNEQGRLAKQERSINSYVQALGQQQKALELAGQRAVLGVGRGDRQNSLNGELNSQQDRFAQQALDLENQRSDPSRNMSDEEYTKKSQALADANKKATDQIRQNYADVETAQGDWTKGASSAWENYLDSAKNIAGQTKSLFTNAFSSMEDALVNFALTGKLSFSDFAKSILADMARIATRQASSSLLSSLVGAGVSYFSASGTGSESLGASQAGYSSAYFPQAKGGAWMDGVKMFANGGAFTNSVVSTPTAFGMSGGGTGVMGEAGPEAIMPLTRTSTGALGVRAMGGGGSNVQISAPVSITVEDRSSEGMSLDQAALAQNLQIQMRQAADKAIADSWRAGGVSFRNTRT